MNKFLWISWLCLTVLLGGYYVFTITSAEDKSELLIGESTYGHYQIELACSSCHTDPFGGPDVIQDACTSCHEQELEQAHDSHPKKKFTDPREAYRLEIIDARYCISCHTEHQKEQTHAMGVSLPDDYCFHCHQEIGEERDSHKDLPFDSCANAGCHNYHDNRALYENFLLKHAQEPWLKDIAAISKTSHAALNATTGQKTNQVAGHFQDQYPAIHQDWQSSAHAQANVTCNNCHTNNTTQPDTEWIEKPGVNECQQCHQQETRGFLSGKHGMRLAPELSTALTAITPKQSPLAFTPQSLDAQHGCNSCHNSHTFNTQSAGFEACIACHNDQHSQSFIDSPHGKLWQQALNNQLETEKAVNCATCHLPRVSDKNHGTNVDSNKNKESIIRVEHNQNLMLRPNEKMIRPICMQCHGLAFSINALADQELIKRNFNGQPKTHVESIDWAIKRDQKNN